MVIVFEKKKWGTIEQKALFPFQVRKWRVKKVITPTQKEEEDSKVSGMQLDE